MKSPLVVASLGIHVVVVLGLFIAGFWKLDRLDPERTRIDLAVAPTPPPAPSGSPAAGPMEKFNKKKPRVIAKDIVVPTKPDPETTSAATTTTDTGGTGGTGSGAGSGSGTDPDGTGDCVGDHCGKAEVTKQEAPKLPPATPTVVPPAVIKGLRIAGETQIHPPANVKTMILRDGKTKVTASYRVCIGIHGEVSSAKAVKSSGYPGYDAALDAGVAAWRYRPYLVDNRPVPVCGVVTFLYAIQ